MELISWSLNAIDKIFSTRSAGSGEPACPDGTFAAGYVMDSWGEWRVICLAVLSLEDVEDIYLFGFLIAGQLLSGLGAALLYREIRRLKKSAANLDGPKLAGLIHEVGRVVVVQSAGISKEVERRVSELGRMVESILKKLAALQNMMDKIDQRAHPVDEE